MAPYMVVGFNQGYCGIFALGFSKTLFGMEGGNKGEREREREIERDREREIKSFLTDVVSAIFLSSLN
jgi:hypothetical protein